MTFVARFLRSLLADTTTLLTVGQSGGVWIGPEHGRRDSGAYGLRVAMPDLTVKGLSNLAFQLGAADTGWIGKAKGTVEPDMMGLSAYLPIRGDVPDFGGLTLNFGNVGVDFRGRGGKPLVRGPRFTLEAVRLRGLLSLDFGRDPVVVSSGGMMALADIGLALAPNTVAPGGNPVAQNLLNAGSDTRPDDKNPPTNPPFSVSAGYVSDLFVELSSDQGSSEERLWIPLQRDFGPLHANQIGVGWKKDRKILEMLFDGSAALAGLSVGVEELSVGIPVSTPTDYTTYPLDLAGLDIAFGGGGVAVSGSLLKHDNPLSYTGAILMKGGNSPWSALAPTP